MFIPRPKQAEVLAYTGGKMGVSAVPGSGKTQTLSALAAKLVAEGMLDDDQEVLIVTLVNSAVDNFARRVDGFVQERGLLPHVGYRVRTLHGLAHDIVRERPDLVGLTNDFSIVDERDATRILQEAAEAWIAAHPDAADQWLEPRPGRAQTRLGAPRPLAQAGRHPGRQLHPPGQGPGAHPGAAAGTHQQPVGA